jgi:thiol-disulfide isomerase/thioredoxin
LLQRGVSLPLEIEVAVQRNPLILFFIGALVAVMLVTGIRMSRQTGAVAPKTGLMGLTAPDFELQAVDGSSLKLSHLRGKAVLLNFWATYCAPCKVEMPWFVQLQNQYGPQGLQIVGVAMDDADAEDIAKFAKDLGVNYPILIGKEAVGITYGGVNVLPTTFFLDRNGKVVAREFGLQSRSVFVDHIKEALGPSATAQALK